MEHSNQLNEHERNYAGNFSFTYISKKDGQTQNTPIGEVKHLIKEFQKQQQEYEAKRQKYLQQQPARRSRNQ